MDHYWTSLFSMDITRESLNESYVSKRPLVHNDQGQEERRRSWDNPLPQSDGRTWMHRPREDRVVELSKVIERDRAKI